MAGVDRSGPDLLVTRVARRLRLDRVAGRLGYPGTEAYLYVASLIVIDQVVLSGLQYAREGTHPALVFPLWFVPPVATLLVLLATRHLVRIHDGARETLRERATDPGRLDGPLAPLGLQGALYAALVAGAVAFFFLQPEMRAARIALVGEFLFPVKFVVVFLGLYYPVVAEVAGVMVGVYVLLPRRLIRAGVELDFGDRVKLGGLTRVGALIQRSTQVYFGGLFVFTVATFAPRIFPSQPTPIPGTLVSAAFLGAWIAGFVLFALPTVWLHFEIQRQKQDRLETLQERLRRHGEHDECIPDRPADGELDEYLYLQLALGSVERTREYPTNAGLVRDLFVSSLPSMATYLAALIGAQVGI
jgi:hypothetical protein